MINFGPKSWTSERDDRLRELWSSPDHSCARIAGVLNEEFPSLPMVNKNGVIGRSKRINLGPKQVVRSGLVRPFKNGVRKPYVPPVDAPASLSEPSEYSDYVRKLEANAFPTVEVPANQRMNGDCGCRWPVGLDALADDYFCGRKRERKSYCAEHARIAFR